MFQRGMRILICSPQDIPNRRQWSYAGKFFIAESLNPWFWEGGDKAKDWTFIVTYKSAILPTLHFTAFLLSTFENVRLNLIKQESKARKFLEKELRTLRKPD